MTLPPGIDAKAMLPRAVTARVAYVPGTAFFADGFGSGSMRLSFCYPTPERIREGVRRLAGVLEAEMELRATFGAGPPGPRARPAAATTPRAPTSAERMTTTGDHVSTTETPDRRPTGGTARPTGGCWCSPAGSRTSATSRCARAAGSAEALRGAGLEVVERDVDAALLARCAPSGPPCVVPMLHGETGEDGAIREVLELLDVPYVGAPPGACRIAFDKPVAKAVAPRGRDPHAPRRSACRTRRSASSARPR